MQEQPRQSLSRHSRAFAAICGFALGASILASCGSQPAAPAASEPTSSAAEAPAAQATAAPAAEPTAAPAAETNGEAVTIQWMIWSDDIANEKNLITEVQMFNDAHPDIKVELVGATWSEFTPKIQAMTAAGTPPDVVSIQNEADFVSKGFLQPLDEVMASDSAFDANRFLPGALTPAYDGKTYGLRHDNAYWMLYFNKDMFDAAGIAYPPAEGYSLDEFMNVACQLSKADQGQWGMSNLHWLTGVLTQQQGLPYISMVDGVPKYQIDDPATMAFYQKVADFINVNNCQPTTDQNSSIGNADAFLIGKAAMAFNGNWGFGNVKENAQFKWDVSPVPGLKQTNVGMKIGLAAGGKHQEAAWTFLKWLTYEPEATRFRSEHGMGQPAINDEEAINTFLTGPVSPANLPTVFDVLSKPENNEGVVTTGIK